MRLRDYKSNKNAIMKEIDHALLIESTIKKIDNDWVECKMKVEANIDRVQIVFGPTDLSKQVELWEAGSDFISSVYSTIPTFTIK